MTTETAPPIVAALERFPDAALLVDEGLRYVSANAAATTLFGVAATELEGHSIPEFLILPQSEFFARWRQFLASGSTTMQFDLQRPDGRIVTVRMAGAAYVGPGVHLVTLNDLSDRMRIDRRVRAAEERLAKIFYRGPAAMFVVSWPGLVYRDVNQEFLDLTGYWRADVVGRATDEIGLLADTAARAQSGELLRQHGSASNLLVSCRLKSGELRPMVASFTLVSVGGETLSIGTLTPASFASAFEPEELVARPHPRVEAVPPARGQRTA
jgi:PAS domain S-box-containing protein